MDEVSQIQEDRRAWVANLCQFLGGMFDHFEGLIGVHGHGLDIRQKGIHALVEFRTQLLQFIEGIVQNRRG